MPTPPGARKATKAAARPKAPRPVKLSARNQTLYEQLQRPSGGSFTAAQAMEFAQSQEREDRAAKKRRSSVLRSGGPSSEGMMANEASRQSRQALSRSAAAPSTSRAAPRAGQPVSLKRATAKAPKPVKAVTRSSSGSLELRGASARNRYKPQRPPLERTSGGGVSLRGGSRRYRRDRKGRFA